MGFLCLSSFINAQAQPVFTEKTIPIDTSYLESKNLLSDYILDTGDRLNIEFIHAPALSGSYLVDEQGEIYLSKKFTYVRGLTITELSQLLEARYKEFLIDPEIYIRINTNNKITRKVINNQFFTMILHYLLWLKTDLRPRRLI